MTQQTFIQGFRRVLNSHQVQLAFGSLTSAWLAVHYAVASLPPAERTALWIAFLGAVYGIIRETLNSFAEQDVAAINSGQQPGGTVPPVPFQPTGLIAANIAHPTTPIPPKYAGQ